MPPNYAGQNLRGQNFKGLDLTGANFSYADIRSADFSGAILRGASFSHAKAGLQKRWLAFLIAVSLLISGLAGFLSASIGDLISNVFNSSSLENQVSGWAALIAVIIVFIVIIRQGLNSAVAISISIAGAVAISLVGVVAVVKPITSAVVVAGAIAFVGAGGVAIAGAIAFAVAVAGVISGAIVGAITVAIAGANGGDGAGGVAFIGALLSIYISRRALEGDEKYALIRDIAVAFAAIGGTSFRSCDLTDTDFTEANLKSTDFRKAILTRTCFYKAKKLERVRPGLTYLQKSQVCQVLVTGLGQDKNFDRLYLRGVNFKNAHLVDASFIGADLSGANLQDADLTRAKLQQTQLDGTDFTGATLTGAYIQDWNITSDTKFDGVRCQYVYMRVPTKENPDPLRKPDNNKEVFADGEFGDFIQPIFDTLDLYHNSSVDPRAIAISFKQLAEHYSDADLRIVEMEVRGEDKFLIRAKTAPQANKSALSAEYFETYNHIKGLPEREIKLLLAEKDNRIRSLENMVVTALQHPSFYAQTYQNQGDTMSEKSENSTYNLNNAKFGGGFAGTGGTQTGGIFYDYSSNPSLAEAATEIQQILQRLEATNLTTNNAGKRAVVNQAIDEIENDTDLKARVVAALNSSSTEALEAAINHPLAKNMMSFLEELVETS